MSKNNDRELEDGQDRLPHLMRIDALAEVLGVSVRASPPSAGTGAADPLPEGGPPRQFDGRECQRRSKTDPLAPVES